MGRSVSKTAYELARALSLTAGTEQRQEDLLREAYDHLPPRMGRLESSIALRLAGLLRRTSRLPEARDWALRAVERSPSDPTATWELAEALRALDRPAEALAAIDRWTRQPLRADEAVSRTAAVADLALPLTRARALVSLRRAAEAAEVLSDCARSQGVAFDQWPLLASLLRDQQPDWAGALADLCPEEAFGLLGLLDVLGTDDARLLLSALRARGIDPAAHAADASFRAQLADTLADQDPGSIARAALALEGESPHLALQAWLQLPASGPRQVALARCHLALDDLDGAFAALDDLDVTTLDPPDLVTVALLAAHAGDADTAWAVLDLVPDPPPPDVAGQVALLGTSLPARVHLA